MIYKRWASNAQGKLALVSKLMNRTFSIKNTNANVVGMNGRKACDGAVSQANDVAQV